jgi:hypothetical protein
MEVGDCKVWRRVAIELAHGYVYRVTVDKEILRRLEGAIAVAQQHGNGVVKMVGNHQIQLAIFIEVAHSQEIRMRHAHTAEGLRYLKGAITVA